MVGFPVEMFPGPLNFQRNIYCSAFWNEWFVVLFLLVAGADVRQFPASEPRSLPPQPRVRHPGGWTKGFRIYFPCIYYNLSALSLLGDEVDCITSTQLYHITWIHSLCQNLLVNWQQFSNSVCVLSWVVLFCIWICFGIMVSCDGKIVADGSCRLLPMRETIPLKTQIFNLNLSLLSTEYFLSCRSVWV